MARRKTIEAFFEWVENPENVEMVLELIAGGKTLQQTAREVKQPYTCLQGFLESPENVARYNAARKAWADAVMDEAMEIADGVVPTQNEVMKAKLRIETRMSQAGAYHREKWGEQKDQQRGPPVTIQIANLRGAQVEVKTIEAGALPALEEKS